MGLLDNLFDGPNSRAALTKEEAFAGILLGAVACDGNLAAEEVQTLVAITRRMSLYAETTPHQWRVMTDHLDKVMKREGVLPMVEQCAAALPEELRECAFANACDLVLADRFVEPEEKQFLDRLIQILKIDGDTALTIAEVIKIKNKG